MSIGNFIDSLESRVYTARGIIRGRIEEKEANLRMAYELGRVIGADQIREKRAAVAVISAPAPVVTVSASPALLAYLSSDEGHADDAPVICVHCGFSGHLYTYTNDYSIADLSAGYAAGNGAMSSDEAASRYFWGVENDICPECYQPLNAAAIPAYSPESEHELVDPEELWHEADYHAGDVYLDDFDSDYEEQCPLPDLSDCQIEVIQSFDGTWYAEIHFNGSIYGGQEFFDCEDDAAAWAQIEAQAVIDNL